MKHMWTLLTSSIGRKYLMALTGVALTGFVLVHMVGNLQFFLGKDALNAYAHHLQTLPLPVLWGFRLFLLACVSVHVFVGVWLKVENYLARKKGYAVEQPVQATFSSKTMIWTGLILFAFVAFHIVHFTVRVFPEKYRETVPLTVMHSGHGEEEVFDVHAMVVKGFSKPWVSVFYIFAMAALCLHLSHGASSMFQTIGFRNQHWRALFDAGAVVYGWLIFLGFISTPVAVMMGWVK